MEHDIWIMLESIATELSNVRLEVQQILATLEGSEIRTQETDDEVGDSDGRFERTIQET